jgi:hypothetical protein
MYRQPVINYMSRLPSSLLVNNRMRILATIVTDITCQAPQFLYRAHCVTTGVVERGPYRVIEGAGGGRRRGIFLGLSGDVGRCVRSLMQLGPNYCLWCCSYKDWSIL